MSPKINKIIPTAIFKKMKPTIYYIIRVTKKSFSVIFLLHLAYWLKCPQGRVWGLFGFGVFSADICQSCKIGGNSGKKVILPTMMAPTVLITYIVHLVMENWDSFRLLHYLFFIESQSTSQTLTQDSLYPILKFIAAWQTLQFMKNSKGSLVNPNSD